MISSNIFKGGKKKKNAAIILLTKKKDRVLLLHHTNKWGTPGGILNHKENPWKGMNREFKEETTIELPEVKNIDNSPGKIKYIDVNNTRVYIGYTPDCFKKLISKDYKIENSNETDKWGIPKLTDIFNNPKSKFYIDKLKKRNKASFEKARKKGFFSHILK